MRVQGAVGQSRQIESIFVTPRPDHISLGRILLERRQILTWQFFYALTKSRVWDSSPTDILMAKGWVSEDQIQAAWSKHLGCPIVDLNAAPPDPALALLLDADIAVKLNAVPWVRLNGQLIVVVSDPACFETLRQRISEDDVLIAIAPRSQITRHITQAYASQMLYACETRLPETQSCRGWHALYHLRVLSLVCASSALFVVLAAYPATFIWIMLIAALITQCTSSALKAAALLASRTRDPNPPPKEDTSDIVLPRISMMVPLYKETEIADALVRRLSALTYPRALLDVVLVLEEKDSLTQKTLSATELPRWMRVIKVPCSGGLTTKPRAMNYALDFCRGDIIGIWDAEDAPAPDQLEEIAAGFATAEENVACIQGTLDYYNPYTNWIARCFTLEYSIWFRIVLKGFARLGFPIPLGGTTLFIKRDVLEQVGRWDAHNVTEDADLGIRLARHGYKTILSHTVTQEEANCQPLAWIQQRSRWLKGYMVTYLVHMRHPGKLLSDLGARKFVGFNLLFLTTILHFPLAPLIWSYWLMLFGIADPLNIGPYPAGMTLAVGLFLSTATALDVILACIAIHGQGRARLMPWSLCFSFYYPLATLASYKAIYELIFRPFYWDKTEHGKTIEGQEASFSAVSPKLQTRFKRA